MQVKRGVKRKGWLERQGSWDDGSRGTITNSVNSQITLCFRNRIGRLYNTLAVY